MTDFITYQQRLEALLQLIRQKRTGSAKKLSAKFNVSERTIKRMIDNLRCQGYKIKFSRNNNSYIIFES
jgi:predicted DNA-binding transcriptional regulator YafY